MTLESGPCSAASISIASESHSGEDSIANPKKRRTEKVEKHNRKQIRHITITKSKNEVISEKNGESSRRLHLNKKGRERKRERRRRKRKREREREREKEKEREIVKVCGTSKTRA